MPKIYQSNLSFHFIFIILILFLNGQLVFGQVNSDDSLNKAQEKKAIVIDEANLDDESEDVDDFEDDFEDEFSDSEEEIFDPLSGYNIVMTEFNDSFYIYIVDPVARGYRWVLPSLARRGIKNFFHNILFPIRFINNTLQLKGKNAGEELLRFSINSTIGLFGLWDPAKEWFGLEAHDEDFGQTLGYYGVGGGFHIVLPFLGPSNLRDMFSLYPDIQVDPMYHVEKRPYNFPKKEGEYLNVSRQTLQTLNTTIFKTVNNESLRIGQYENLKKDAIELYPFLRDVYEQNRAKQIEE